MNPDSAARVAKRIEALWSEASLRGDVDAILSLYTADAVFFGSLPTLYVGHRGIREYLADVPLSAARGITFFDRQVRLLGTHTIATASYVHFDLALANGPERWRFGMSWTLLNEHGDWKIASHHASPRPAAAP